MSAATLHNYHQNGTLTCIAKNFINSSLLNVKIKLIIVIVLTIVIYHYSSIVMFVNLTITQPYSNHVQQLKTFFVKNQLVQHYITSYNKVFTMRFLGCATKLLIWSC